jgi:uncharacterized protein YoxC
MLTYAQLEHNMAITANQYAQKMAQITSRTNAATAAGRGLIQDVQSHKKKMDAVLQSMRDAPRDLEEVNKSLHALHEMLAKAKGLTEEKAQEIFKKKDWGTLLDYNAYQKTQPAKPQLIGAVEKALGNVEARGQRLVDSHKPLADKWEAAEKKFHKACEAARYGG